MYALPCDVRRLILERAAADAPSPRGVCRAWRDDVDELVVDARIEELCAMLAACRIRTDRPPKRWRLLYAYGSLSRPHRARDAKPFPWRRALAGPTLAVAAWSALLFLF